jgi:hypothetical protein
MLLEGYTNISIAEHLTGIFSIKGFIIKKHELRHDFGNLLYSSTCLLTGGYYYVNTTKV